jgi:hypothetical protein
MLAVAADSPIGAVIESNFYGRAQSMTFVASWPVVEIFCCCDPTATQSRYVARGGSRHDGHCRLGLASS